MSKKKKGSVILRKIGGLSSIKSGLKSNMREFRQKRINRDKEGEYVGEYMEPNLPGSRHYLSVYWNDLKDQWCWGGSQEDLYRIAKKVKLRMPAKIGYQGEVIKPEEIDLFNPKDPFFTNLHWCARKFMSGGRIMLNLDSEEDEFYYFCYKGSHLVNDTTDQQLSVFRAGAKYEIINPKMVTENKARDAKLEVNALVLLSKMSLDKQKYIASIMNISTDFEDPDRLFLDLKDHAVENITKTSRFGGKTPQEQFISLSKEKNEDLVMKSNISIARNKRILVKRTNYYQFNIGNTDEDGPSTLSDKIDGIASDNQLIAFFRKPENQEYYFALEEQIKKLEK